MQVYCRRFVPILSNACAVTVWDKQDEMQLFKILKNFCVALFNILFCIILQNKHHPKYKSSLDIFIVFSF